MRCQIDQSGKVEDTKSLTIVALADHKVKSLKISAVEKRKLVRAMRILDYPKKTFVVKIFSGLVFLLVKDEKDIEEVVIDREYLGNEPTIKNIIIQLFQRTKRKSPLIGFGTIGKQSKAHKVAIDVFRGKRKSDMMVRAGDIMELFYK